MITVIAVDGALGEIVADILNANDIPASYMSSPALRITDKIVFVTYGFEGFPFVMTKRWLGYNDEDFERWKECWLGKIEINDATTRPDITPIEWNHHVNKSLEHVGVYYPYNGILSTLLDENSAHDLTYCEIELDAVLNRSTDVLRDLSTFTNTNIAYDSYDAVIDSVKSEVMPWILTEMLTNL